MFERIIDHISGTTNFRISSFSSNIFSSDLISLVKLFEIFVIGVSFRSSFFLNLCFSDLISFVK